MGMCCLALLVTYINNVLTAWKCQVGYRYQDGSDIGSWPIYGEDGRLAGLQAAVNVSPETPQIPPWVKVGDLWVLTVYFRSDMSSICDPNGSSGTNEIGDSVYIMVNGTKVDVSPTRLCAVCIS